MADLPLSGLLGLEKIVGWLGEQALVFWHVLTEGPKDFIEKQTFETDEKIKRATLFYAFTVFVCFFVSIPAGILMGFDPSNQIKDMCLVLLSAIEGILFGFVVHFYSKLFRGKGSLTDTMASMMYLTVYAPFIVLACYAGAVNPNIRAATLDPDRMREIVINTAKTDYGMAIWVLSTFVMVFGYLFVYYKTIPVVKLIHKVGSIRGFSIVLISAITFWTYAQLIETPLAMGIIKVGFK